MVASTSNEQATSIARASRVNSSVTLHNFNWRPSLVVSNWQSIAHSVFVESAKGKLNIQRDSTS